MVLKYLYHVSVDLKISVMSEWYYHARILGPQYICHGGLGVPVVLPCQVPRKSISLSWRLGVPVVLPCQVHRTSISLSCRMGMRSGATILCSQEVNISVMSYGESQCCHQALFLGPPYLCHVGPQYLCHLSVVLQYLFHVSVDLNISVMSEWCYHARFLGPQYICLLRRGVSVVLPYQVPRKSISLSCRMGNLSAVTTLGSQEVDISVMVVWEYLWCYHARFQRYQYLCHVGPQYLCHLSVVLQYFCHVRLGVPMVLPCQVPMISIYMSRWTVIPSGATMLGFQEVNIAVMADWESQWRYPARFIGSQYICHVGLGILSGATILGSQEVDISVMSYGESQWCYHARFLEPQYLCHVGPHVLRCQVPRTSIYLSCKTGRISGATMLGSQEVNISVMANWVSVVLPCYDTIEILCISINYFI